MEGRKEGREKRREEEKGRGREIRQILHHVLTKYSIPIHPWKNWEDQRKFVYLYAKQREKFHCKSEGEG